jgi:hypothetical protein
VRAISTPSRFAFAALAIGIAAIALGAGCSGTVGFSVPNPGPTSTAEPPPGTLLTGLPVSLPFVSQMKSGAILVPSQIAVPAGDYATVSAGTQPQASMHPILPAPYPLMTKTVVYTAVRFTKPTKTSKALGLTFALPPSIDPDFGTFYLAVYGAHGMWQSVENTHGAVNGRVTFTPAGGTTSYSANAPHGIALYQVLSATVPVPLPSPSTVQFTELTQRKTIGVTEPGYHGAWTAVSADASIATVTPASGSSRFSVKPLKPGKTEIVFTDSAGGAAGVFIGVTTSGGGIH